MNSQPGKTNYTIYSNTIHPLLSIASPFCFIVTGSIILKDLTGEVLSTGIIQFAIIFGVGIIKILLNKIFMKERVDMINVVREFILTSAVCYGLFSLMQGGPIKDRFYPGIANVYPLILVIIQWFFTFRLHYLFRNRELYLRVVSDKEKDDLITSIRRSAGLAQDTYEDMLHFKEIFNVQRIILFLILIVTAVSGLKISMPAVIWIAIFMLVTFLSSMMINLFKQEQNEMREGFSFSGQTQARRFFYAFFFIVFCILIALLFANNNSLLKVPELKLRSGSGPMEFQPLDIPQVEKPNLDEITGGEHWKLPDLSWLWRMLAPFVKTILIVFITAAILLPFFSKDFLYWLKKIKPLKFLMKKLAALFRVVKNLLMDIRDSFELLLMRKQMKKEVKKKKTDGSNPELVKNHPGFRKRLETNRIIRLFLKLLRWGRKRGVRYYYSQTAVEYIGVLTAQYPALEDSLCYAVSIFEEAVFSRHLIGNKVIGKYRQTIKTIVKTR